MADYTIEVAVPTVGPQGAIGPTGPANTLTVGTVTTGAAGSSAAATVTGTAPSQTLNLTIPRGDTGATGSQGIQGATGESGTTTIAQVDALMSRSYFRDFATHKNLNDHGTGPAITFTRGSTATFFDASGVLQTASTDVPRFDHSGGTSLGLLIEEQRQNLFERSAEFDNAYWTKTNATVTANSVVAPDGTTTADAVFETVNNGFHVIVRSSVLTIDSVHTLSVFAKANGRTKLSLQVGGQQTANFDLTAVTATVIAPTGSPSASIQSVGNGWFRCTATRTSTLNANATILLLDNSGNTEYVGNASLGMYFWGAQAEAGAFATSYIPTTSAAVTRSADSAVVTPISSFYNASEGTLFAEFIPRTRTLDNTFPRTAVSFDSNTGANYVGIGVGTGTDGTVDSVGWVGVTSSLQWSVSGGTSVVGANMRVAGAYAANDAQAAINGSLGTADTSLTLGTLTHMRVGSRFTADRGSMAGHIRRIAYYPKRLTNALLQSLTT